jgi:DNA-binding CsgD family transcriptional regulator
MPDHCALGARFLAGNDWQAAKDAFEAALLGGESAEALTGLGEAVWWLGDYGRAVELRERAYVAFRDDGDLASAARLAVWLAAQHTGPLGNEAVGNGWLGRAERLIDKLGGCAERGWLLLRRARYSHDPLVAGQLADEALDLAHALSDGDLEVAAISQRGRALLACGRTEEGFACLDEAMAAATSGEIRNAETISDTCCDMIVACERTMEIARAAQWCQVTEEYAKRYKFLPLFAFCRVTYAGVLIAVGRWPEAERELLEALRSYEASAPWRSIVAIAKLAELRVLQGRDADADALLLTHRQSPFAAKAVGLLHLAGGDPGAAVRVLGKRLAVVENDVLLSAPLLSVLVEAHLANGDVTLAAAAAERLTAIAETTGCAVFAGSAAFAAALVACQREDSTAVDLFESAINTFASAGLPLPAARARLGLARCLADHDERAATDECRVAVAAFEELGAKRELDAAGDLRRRLGVGARVGSRTTSTLTRREEEVLALLGLGLSNAQIAARLFVSPKTVEHHVGHIFEKLGVKTRAAAAAYAVTAGAKKPGPK